MDLLGPSPRLRLNDAEWPLPAAGEAHRTIGSSTGARDADSLIAPACTVRGSVKRSVVFAGAEIRRGAEITDSVILPEAVIGTGCRLRGVIVDSGCRVPDGTVIDRSAGGTVPLERLTPMVLTGDVAANRSEPGVARAFA